MHRQQTSPHGSWRSPIISNLIVSEAVTLGQIIIDGDDIYWVEMRPQEGGRNVVVRLTPDGRTGDVTPPPFNARTRVHEYGGGAVVVGDGTVYFSNFADQRVYRQQSGDQPQPLTPEVDMRYADGVIDHRRRMICVREDHTVPRQEAINSIVGLDLEQGGLATCWCPVTTSMRGRVSALMRCAWRGSPGATRRCHGMAPSYGWAIWSPTGL